MFKIRLHNIVQAVSVLVIPVFHVKCMVGTLNGNVIRWGSFPSFKKLTLKRQPHKMVKHIQTIRRLFPTNCLSVFDHFGGRRLRVKQQAWRQ